MFQVNNSNNSRIVSSSVSYSNIGEKSEKKFNLAMMELDSLSEQANLRVDECREKQQTFLDLSGCTIIDFPKNLLPFLTQLKELNLSNTFLQRLPSDLGVLLSLETLDLRGNPELSISIADIHKALPNVKILLDDRRVSPTSVSESTGQLLAIHRESPIDIDRGQNPAFLNALFKFQIGVADVPTSSKNTNLKKVRSRQTKQQMNVGVSSNSTTLVKQQIPDTMSQTNAPVFEFGYGTVVRS